MNKFIDHQINEYADLPDNMEYETVDDEERRKHYAKSDRKRKLKRKIILCFLATSVAVLYAVVIYVVILTILLGLGE